jgi:hypothetical protein
MRAAIVAALALIACGRDEPAAPPSPPAPHASDGAPAAPPGPAPGNPSPSGRVRWRVPLIQVAAAQLELDWRAPDGATEVGLTLPLRGDGEPGAWDCRPLQAALSAEIERTWPHMVRPSRAKQHVIAASPDARNPDVFHAMDCVRATFNGRDLYPDAMLATP